MNEPEALEHMRRVIRRSGMSAPAWALRLGVARSFLNMVLNGKRPPPESLLRGFGLEREVRVRYRRAKADAQ